MLEKPGVYRVGIEGIYYGRQVLDDNPYRSQSKPYVYAMAIAMRQFGPVEVVANFENLLNVRQTRLPLAGSARSHRGRPLDHRCVGSARRLHGESWLCVTGGTPPSEALRPMNTYAPRYAAGRKGSLRPSTF